MRALSNVRNKIVRRSMSLACIRFSVRFMAGPAPSLCELQKRAARSARTSRRCRRERVARSSSGYYFGVLELPEVILLRPTVPSTRGRNRMTTSSQSVSSVAATSRGATGYAEHHAPCHDSAASACSATRTVAPVATPSSTTRAVRPSSGTGGRPTQ